MSAGDYLEGLAFFLANAGLVLAAAALIVRRRLPHLAGVERALGFALLATACLIGVHLLPGALGILSRGTVLVTALLLALVATRLPRAEAPQPARLPPEPPAGGRGSLALAAVALGVLAVASVAAVWGGAAIPTTEIDSLSFHLPNVARWIQSGSFWQIDVLAPLQPTGHYPNHGDVVALSTMLPWRSDAFVRPLGLPFAAMAGLAAYALAAELGAPRATAALIGALFLSLPIVVSATHVGAKTDPVMLACFGSGMFFLTRHFRTALRADLVLAGLGLGLALGTKWYGLTSAIAVLACWAGIWLYCRRPLGALLRAGGVLVGVIAAAGGFWMLRNLVESGNPVFPVEVGLFGITLFDAPLDVMRECGGYSVSDYITDGGIWKDYFLPAYRDRLWLPGLALGGALITAVAVLAVPALRRRTPLRDSGAVPLILAGVVGLMLVAYLVTPYTALGPPGKPAGVISNVRWLGPACLVAAALGAWGLGRLGRARIPAEALVALAVVAGVVRGFADPVRPLLGAVVALAAAAGVGHLLYRRRSRAGLAVAAAATLAVLAVGAYERQRDFYAARYTDGDPALTWIVENAPEHRRIGLAGPWEIEGGISPIHPAFGTRFRNEVEYVGDFSDDLMLDHESRRDFLAAVERGRYDLLLVGRSRPARSCEHLRHTDENAWLRAAGYTPFRESERFVLYRLGGARGRA